MPCSITTPALILGRTKAKTLRLSQDDIGLKFSCDLPDTQAGRDVLASIKRGDIDQCSFGFIVNKHTWIEDGDTYTRQLDEVDLFDVSPGNVPGVPTDHGKRPRHLAGRRAV